MRVANRTRTDDLLLAVLDRDNPFDEWTYLEDVSDSPEQAMRAANHLMVEYDAVELLPLSKAIRLKRSGVEAYLNRSRLYHPTRLGEHERV